MVHMFVTCLPVLQDANHDGCIGWGEFEAFMMDEFAAGKHLLSGEYVLPSGEHAAAAAAARTAAGSHASDVACNAWQQLWCRCASVRIVACGSWHHLG